MIAWMPVAWGELGVHETPGPTATARIIEYGTATTLKPTSDEIPWCSDFVNWVMRSAGMPRTASAAAKSWLGWGYVTVPRYGSVIVLSRPPNPKEGHVGFFVDMDATRVWLLAGNQGDRVCVADFPLTRMVDARWPFAP